jgi:hypothetical protein
MKVHLLHRKKVMCGNQAEGIRTVHFKCIDEVFNKEDICARCLEILKARKANPGAG